MPSPEKQSAPVPDTGRPQLLQPQPVRVAGALGYPPARRGRPPVPQVGRSDFDPARAARERLRGGVPVGAVRLAGHPDHRATAVSSGPVPVPLFAQFPPEQRPPAELAMFRFITSQFPAPVRGLFVAAMLAAIMSTLDAGINCLAAVITKDFLSLAAQAPASRPETAPLRPARRVGGSGGRPDRNRVGARQSRRGQRLLRRLQALGDQKPRPKTFRRTSSPPGRRSRATGSTGASMPAVPPMPPSKERCSRTRG